MTIDQEGLDYWMDKAGSKPILDHYETNLIAKKIQSSGPGSKSHRFYVNKLVEHNLRLVIKFVHLFMKSKSHKDWGSSETLDYLQVGTLGLVRAAEKFDPTKGYRFSTYATFWIRSYVGRYNIKTSSIFFIPEDTCRKAHYFRQHNRPVTRKSGAIPDYEETREAVKLITAAQSPISLDIPFGKEQNLNLMDTLESHYNSEDSFQEGCFTDLMEEAFELARLSEKQVAVLRAVYVNKVPISEVQTRFNLTRDQCARLRKDAFERLRGVLEPV